MIARRALLGNPVVETFLFGGPDICHVVTVFWQLLRIHRTGELTTVCACSESPCIDALPGLALQRCCQICVNVAPAIFASDLCGQDLPSDLLGKPCCNLSTKGIVVLRQHLEIAATRTMIAESTSAAEATHEFASLHAFPYPTVEVSDNQSFHFWPKRQNAGLKTIC